jgi:ribonuclease HI
VSNKEVRWERKGFKRNKVWLAVDPNGSPIRKNNKVLIKYQLDQEHQYWVHPSSVYQLSDDGTLPSTKPAAGGPVSQEKSAGKTPEGHETIAIFTDGACSGNPGPAGIGIVMRYKGHEKEISRHIGQATNNIAELEAIRTALAEVKNQSLPVVVYTDSSYALGILTKGWKAKQNLELVSEIRNLMKRFKDLHWVKVKGHAGHPENERADQLAVEAIRNGLDTTTAN